MRHICTLITVTLLVMLCTPLLAKEKVVVIGIDAVDQRLIEKWMEEGKLPNFKKLSNQGHYSALETSHPPMSPAAWSTMTTGLNPGKTGIYGFLGRKQNSYEPKLSLVYPNEQPFAFGSRASRLLVGLMIAALLIAIFWTISRKFIRHRKLSPIAAASVTVAMCLLAPATFTGTISNATVALGGLGLMALVFSLLSAVGRLSIASWVFPILALGAGIFGVLDHLPETLPQPITARGGQTFWDIADGHGVRAKVIGAPVCWPALEEYNDSGMTTGLATPDAMGTYHTYTLFTEPHHNLAGGLTEMSGRIEGLDFEDDTARATLAGPPKRFDRKAWRAWQNGELKRIPREHIPFTVTREAGGVRLDFDRAHAVGPSSVTLKVGQWVRHIRLKYSLGEVAELHGTVSFKLLAGGHQVRLYATPVQFDPLKPHETFAISSPMEFASEIANRFGMYQTIGWAEATSALNDGNIDDETFMETCRHSFDEKRAQILGLLRTPDEWDLLVAFAYELDRVCHMMWRHFDKDHPVHDADAPTKFKNAICDFYVKYDSLLGEILEALPQDTTLIVLSDHGFAPFYQAVNLNRWLLENGYIVLKDKTGSPDMTGLMEGESSYFASYDWSKTRAFAMGLTKIYVNERGRMPQGCVEPGAESEAVKDGIIAGLEALRHGQKRVIRKVWRKEEIWEGSRLGEAPDLQIGFNWGYRTSWQTSLGGADEEIIQPNLRNWSGDHCSFDPAIVPGVVFSNRKLNAQRFRLVDVGMTVLKIMQVPLPENRGSKDGHPWQVSD